MKKNKMKEFNFWWLLVSASFCAGAAPGSWMYDDSFGGGAVLKRAAAGDWMYGDLGGGAILKRAPPSIGGMWNQMYKQRREPNDKWGEFWGENAWKRSYPGSFRPGSTADAVGVYKRAIPPTPPSASYITKYRLPQGSTAYKRAFNPYEFLSAPF